MLPRFDRFARRTSISSAISSNSVEEGGIALPLRRIAVHQDLAHGRVGHALVAVDDAFVDVVAQDVARRARCPSRR